MRDDHGRVRGDGQLVAEDGRFDRGLRGTCLAVCRRHEVVHAGEDHKVGGDIRLPQVACGIGHGGGAIGRLPGRAVEQLSGLRYGRHVVGDLGLYPHGRAERSGSIVQGQRLGGPHDTRRRAWNVVDLNGRAEAIMLDR